MNNINQYIIISVLLGVAIFLISQGSSLGALLWMISNIVLGFILL